MKKLNIIILIVSDTRTTTTDKSGKLLKKHILSKEQTNIVNKIIESYYENNNTKSKELTEKKYEADICPICLEEYNEEKRIVTKCGHVFHDECLNQWIEASSNYSCPYCKEIVSSNFNAIFTDEINNIL